MPLRRLRNVPILRRGLVKDSPVMRAVRATPPRKQNSPKQQVTERGPPRRRRRWTPERHNYQTRATSGSWAGPDVAWVGSDLARRFGWHIAEQAALEVDRVVRLGRLGRPGKKPPKPRHPTRPPRNPTPDTAFRPATARSRPMITSRVRCVGSPEGYPWATAEHEVIQKSDPATLRGADSE